jgi:hypothetical protein
MPDRGFAMMLGHQRELCELCTVGIRGASALCASCSEMIARLSHIAREAGARPISPPTRAADKRVQAQRAARLFERALNINIFTVSQYKR